MPQRALPYFAELNDFYAGVGFGQRTSTPDFYVFRIEETYPDVRQFMEPFRKSFYHLALIYHTQGLRFELNASTFEPQQNILLCHSPDHIHSWQRNEHMGGFVVNFKESFLAEGPASLREELPFFDLLNLNSFELDEAESTLLHQDLSLILSEYRSARELRLMAVRGYLAALLCHCREIYGRHTGPAASPAPHDAPATLLRRYRALINNFYHSQRSVEEYAAQLHVSTGYLWEVSKAVAGRTPKSFIDERLLLEIQNLLRYTTYDVAQIAYKLNFSEPTNLGKFFKKHKGLSPSDFRQQLRGSAAGETGRLSRETD